MASPSFYLVLAREAVEHFDAIDKKYHRLLMDEMDEQLTFTPEEETRNRKPLKQPAPFGATWELRCGPDNRFRVYYEVKQEESIVRILAVGIKRRNRTWFGGEEYFS